MRRCGRVFLDLDGVDAVAADQVVQEQGLGHGVRELLDVADPGRARQPHQVVEGHLARDFVGERVRRSCGSGVLMARLVRAVARLTLARGGRGDRYDREKEENAGGLFHGNLTVSQSNTPTGFVKSAEEDEGNRRRGLIPGGSRLNPHVAQGLDKAADELRRLRVRGFEKFERILQAFPQVPMVLYWDVPGIIEDAMDVFVQFFQIVARGVIDLHDIFQLAWSSASDSFNSSCSMMHPFRGAVGFDISIVFK